MTWIGPGGLQTLQTATPAQVVSELSQALGGDIPGLTVTRPTLEDVYLALIGAQR